MRIDSSGNVLVGTTSANPTSSGVNTPGQELSATGGVRSTVDSNPAATFNRKTDDGSIVLFRKNGTTVGSIGTEGSDLTIGDAGAGLQFRSADPCVRPHNMTTNSPSDNAVDLGRSNTRFKNLYLSGGVYLGGTGAANYLDDYEEGTWTPVISGITSATESKSGWYWKIGNMVVVQCVISLPSAVKTSSSVSVSGFPFSASQTVLGSYHFVNNVSDHFSDPQIHGSFNKYVTHNYTTSMQKYDGTQLVGNDVASTSPELYLYVVYPD